MTTIPKDWVWAYHVTPNLFLQGIKKEGLKPSLHTNQIPVLFVEPDLNGVKPYIEPGTSVLRFKTPGFATTEDGECILIGGSVEENGIPDKPFVGKAGECGAIPPDTIQILNGRKWKSLLTRLEKS